MSDAGKVFSIIWTLTGIVIISMLTGSIATALTSETVEQEIMLYGAKVRNINLNRVFDTSRCLYSRTALKSFVCVCVLRKKYLFHVKQCIIPGMEHSCRHVMLQTALVTYASYCFLRDIHFTVENDHTIDWRMGIRQEVGIAVLQ